VTIYGRPREAREVVDRLLWRDAQLMLSRHSGLDRWGNCAWCRMPQPCPARRLAQRAQAVAYEPDGTQPVQLHPAVTPRRPASAA
jgi:hypothetical protein